MSDDRRSEENLKHFASRSSRPVERGAYMRANAPHNGAMVEFTQAFPDQIGDLRFKNNGTPISAHPSNAREMMRSSMLAGWKQEHM